jgi:hypothetical protein
VSDAKKPTPPAKADGAKVIPFDKQDDIHKGAVEEVAEALDGPTPAIGRIVHYVTAQGTIRPAIIAGLKGDETVEVVVFNSDGAVFINKAPFDNEFPGETPGTVFWPKRD